MSNLENPENKTLGEIIKQDLVDNGLKQSVVAKKMNVSKQVINQIDRRKNFDLGFLLKLREVTGLDYTKYIPSRYPQNVSQEVGDSTQKNQQNIDVVEVTLNIKVKSTADQLGRVGELITIFRKQAMQMGFTVA